MFRKLCMTVLSIVSVHAFTKCFYTGNNFLFVTINTFMQLAPSVSHISCITQVTLKLINDTKGSLNFIRLLRVVITHSVTSLLRGENDSKQQDEFQATQKVARLDFSGGYLPRLCINYIGKSKDMEKRLPQLYYIKMKLSYDLGFIAIGVTMAT